MQVLAYFGEIHFDPVDCERLSKAWEQSPPTGRTLAVQLENGEYMNIGTIASFELRGEFQTLPPLDGVISKYTEK